MGSLNASMREYRAQLQKGMIQKAYKGLMETLTCLKSNLEKAHPEFGPASALYFGYMDMSYFSLFPKKLKERGLKIAVVYLHVEGRFEVWLSGANRKVGAEYWQLVHDAGWEKYRLVPSPKGSDSIIECIISAGPDFDHPDELSRQVDTSVVQFIQEIERFLVEKNL
jgi:hypothetical protein